MCGVLLWLFLSIVGLYDSISLECGPLLPVLDFVGHILWDETLYLVRKGEKIPVGGQVFFEILVALEHTQVFPAHCVLNKNGTGEYHFCLNY